MSVLLTPAQAAARLGITVEELTAWRWQQRGPQFVRYGGSIRYSEDALAVWLRRAR